MQDIDSSFKFLWQKNDSDKVRKFNIMDCLSFFLDQFSDKTMNGRKE